MLRAINGSNARERERGCAVLEQMAEWPAEALGATTDMQLTEGHGEGMASSQLQAWAAPTPGFPHHSMSLRSSPLTACVYVPQAKSTPGTPLHPPGATSGWVQ